MLTYLQHGQTHRPLWKACSHSSPCRFFRQFLLQQQQAGAGLRHMHMWQRRGKLWYTLAACVCAYQKLVGILLPFPHCALLQVTWSSSVFCRHLSAGAGGGRG